MNTMHSYAKALLEPLDGDEARTRISIFLGEIEKLWTDNQFVRTFYYHPLVDLDTKIKVFVNLLGCESSVFEIKIISLLLKNKRLSHIAALNRAYSALKLHYDSVLVCQVRSNTELTEDQKTSLVSVLHSRYHKNIQLMCQLDSKVQGVQLLVGLDLLECTFSSLLDQLISLLKKGSFS